MFLPALTVAVLCAQFSNHSLGVSGNATTSIEKDPLYSLSLEGTWYIEKGFDLYVQIPIGLTTVLTGPSPSGTFGFRQTLTTGGHVGVRYLFLEEHLRPYAGVHLASVVVLPLTTDPIPFGGIGATLGIELFVTDSIAIGARGHYDLMMNFIRPESGPRQNFGASVGVSTFF